MHRLIGIEEARPRHAGNLGRKRARTRAAVKRVVPVPQRQPPLVVRRYGRADEKRVRHGADSMMEESTSVATLTFLSVSRRSLQRNVRVKATLESYSC